MIIFLESFRAYSLSRSAAGLGVARLRGSGTYLAIPKAQRALPNCRPLRAYFEGSDGTKKLSATNIGSARIHS